ncbi:LINE-type retrotransposon LIb DNA, Insertion at the S11 site-like protein [Gossypium australe]|uniref:LINE-type retrotransposon LIb DNA, Insertion at the S11 site-like protein n=1 Tax=Gossypium australe TaxID=47621 RepID=A0A5B6WMM5_9ROSI|nr:LINE-type retrotransposon LIb DNA, Insertion at the S11 site-like protein [Gossypium australe]
MEDTESRKVSFREMLMVNVGGFAGGSVGVTNEGLVNEDFEILEGDVKVSLDGPYLDIFLPDRVQEMLDRNVEQTVVVRLLGRTIGYKALLNRIQTLWKASSLGAVTSPRKKSILRKSWYGCGCQACLTGTLGRVVKIDYNTTAGKRGKFARFAVVVDLLKPLKDFVGIDGIPYCVEYEGLPSIC